MVFRFCKYVSYFSNNFSNTVRLDGGIFLLSYFSRWGWVFEMQYLCFFCFREKEKDNFLHLYSIFQTLKTCSREVKKFLWNSCNITFVYCIVAVIFSCKMDLIKASGQARIGFSSATNESVYSKSRTENITEQLVACIFYNFIETIENSIAVAGKSKRFKLHT